MKIRAEIKIRNRKIIGEISKTKIWFFKMINKIDRSLAGITRRKERVYWKVEVEN